MIKTKNALYTQHYLIISCFFDMRKIILLDWSIWLYAFNVLDSSMSDEEAHDTLGRFLTRSGNLSNEDIDFIIDRICLEYLKTSQWKRN